MGLEVFTSENQSVQIRLCLDYHVQGWQQVHKLLRLTWGGSDQKKKNNNTGLFQCPVTGMSNLNLLINQDPLNYGGLIHPIFHIFLLNLIL